MTAPVLVYKGEEIARYGFGDPHPFGTDRHDVFHGELAASSAADKVTFAVPRRAGVTDLELFHTPDYVEFVAERSKTGGGFLDDGDTPAIEGIFDAACDVVGTVLAAVDEIMTGKAQRAFIPIAGLHHAARDHAAGFCVFNDCGVAAEYLRRRHGLQRIA